MQAFKFSPRTFGLSLCLFLGALPMISPAVAAAPFSQPAATPENVNPDTGDFPYLPSMPGSSFSHSLALPNGVWHLLVDIKEEEFVAKRGIWKTYTPPADATNESVYNFYVAALTNAKWSILLKRPEDAVARTSGAIYAHYGLNGRNIWVTLLIGKGQYDIVVGDATVSEAELAAGLAAQCHLALTGVLFDFNTSKLRPESDPVLEQVAAMMTDQPKLKLEIQAYTDGAGSEESDLSLSKARADAVVAWLTSHGVAAGQLNAQGFGKLNPVASNDTARGRGQNRRVEIANKACKSAQQ